MPEIDGEMRKGVILAAEQGSKAWFGRLCMCYPSVRVCEIANRSSEKQIGKWKHLQG